VSFLLVPFSLHGGPEGRFVGRPEEAEFALENRHDHQHVHRKLVDVEPPQRFE